MAPEQVRAKPLDKRADVFAIGVILYELTTGARLFRGTDVQIMTQVVEQDVARPSSRIPDYPPDLEEIVLAALHRDRARRTPSTAHLAWQLEEFAQRRGMLVGPRAVARYVGQVIPAEPVREEDLALVEPEHDESYEIASPPQAAQDEHVVDLDEDGLLGDLDLLSLPPVHEARGHDARVRDVPQPISLPPDALLDDMLDDEVDRLTAEPPADDAGGFADLLEDGPRSTAPHRGPSGVVPLPRGVVPLPRGAASLPRGGLDLGALDDAERPVVLLGAPKKPAAGPGGSPPARPGGSRDYVRDLERRLASDDDDG